MTDLSTKYLGLALDNPFIVGSSGLTRSADGVAKCADAGAGAVVLKSIFEEQIAAEVEGLMSDSEGSLVHPEAMEYITTYGHESAVSKYLDLIGAAKKRVAVPVIASVHCVSAGKWVEFAQRVEQAGADALELNVFVMPSDPRLDGRAVEQLYFDIIGNVKRHISIPLSIKVGFFFSGLLKMLVDLSNSALDGMVLFNRFYCPDIDLEQLAVRPSKITSTPEEYTRTLRWTSLVADRAGCDIAATTGIHDGKTAAKMLLAGADAVQVVSALYKHGLERLMAMREELEAWMVGHDFASLADFKGKLSQGASDNPSAWARVQFMKHSVGIE